MHIYQQVSSAYSRSGDKNCCDGNIAYFSLILPMLPAQTIAQDPASLEKWIAGKILKNGLTILLCERAEAPVFSSFTIVDVSADQDPSGQSGMAHMFDTKLSRALTERRGKREPGTGKIKAGVRQSESGYAHSALGGVILENRQCIAAGAEGITAIRLFQENPAADLVAQLRHRKLR